MRVFSDKTGQQWEIALTVGSVRRVKGLISVDLLHIDQGDPPLMTRMATDIVLLCDILYALCKPQADIDNVSDEAFGELLDGDAILRANRSFYEEMVEFFQKAGRPDMARAMSKQLRVIELGIQRVDREIDSLEPEKIVGEAFTGLHQSVE